MLNFLFVLFFTVISLWADNQCVVCHKDVENIRDKQSGMMVAILDIAKKASHEGNDCIVCHGGNPTQTSAELAHSSTVEYFKKNKGPKDYYPSPTSRFVNQNTCGICHQEQVLAQNNSLMMTNQNMIQEALWSFGIKESEKHKTANYETPNPHINDERLGTKAYKKYMSELSEKHSEVFVKNTTQLANAPTAQEVEQNPSLAVYTYLRQKQHSTKGCANCHIPYGKKGNLLTHQIQSSRDVNVSLDDSIYSGMNPQTCANCHSDEKSIANSYRGVMGSVHLKEDIHFQKGMSCQDCHTSNDLHGDGFLSGANAGAVEIECQDCHGTTKKYPWELPLGYGDEFGKDLSDAKARGTLKSVAEYLKKGFVAKPKDGYILSSRGNPLVKATKDGNKIIMHLASGKDIQLKPLKLLKSSSQLSRQALIAMDNIESHTQKLECYSCHATWAPQNYGNTLTLDYSKEKMSTDYIWMMHDKQNHAKTQNMIKTSDYLIAGEITQSSAYKRWEDPILAQNAEGRISPIIPSQYTHFNIINEDTKPIKKQVLKSINMTPLQPHTISKKPRSCESCHSSSKALGFGSNYTKDNYTKMLKKDGSQLINVGSHFPLSQPLTSKSRDKLDRRGVCLSCHKNIPNGNLAVSVIAHIAEVAEVNIDKNQHESIVSKLLKIGAWVQMLVVFLLFLLILKVIYNIFFKKEITNPRNEGWK